MKMLKLLRSLRSVVGLALGSAALCLATAGTAGAHPMGNFSINHYARLQVQAKRLHIRYVLDRAEIPTVTEKQTLDRNGDGVVTPTEKADYLAAQGRQLQSGVTVTVNGKPTELKLLSSDLHFAPGAGGLETMKVFLDWQALLPTGRNSVVTWDDRNYPERTGWKEVVAAGGAGMGITDTSVPSGDRSRELSVYPRDVIPPQDTQAHFTAVPGAGAGSATAPVPSSSSASRDATPRDAFTAAIARRELTPGLMLVGLLIAFVFGAFHALSPGHGKTMVAAYLVGTRGTATHAVWLGIIVTVTHTLGVFALGLVTLFASKYVVPEKLYPILSVISGLAVFGVGVWLLVSRLRGPSGTHEHTHEHGPDEVHLHLEGVEHTHSHDHAHDHSHDHAHDEGHSHGFGHHHHHVPDGPITARSLLALGISGGIVPCPSALVVLLSAVALHRIAYGMALITAFSIGLASVLIIIGLLVVSTRHWFERFPASERLLRRLPVASAVAITLIGAMLVIRALTQGV